MPMNMELDHLDLKELKDLRAKVERAIADFEDRKKKQALTALEESARKLGYSLAELTALSGIRKRKPAKPKYANPANASETWSGRGRRPHWVTAALASGKSLNDIAI